MNEHTKIPNQALRLLDQKGYFEVFYEVVSEKQVTHYLAYIEVEARYFEYFSKRKYASYESFRVMKSRYLKSLNNNT